MIDPSPNEISQETAYRILPIAHEYEMEMILMCCEKAFERGQPDLWPSEPIASSKVANHPGLVQCLALADDKHRDSIVQSCLSKLIKPGADDTTMIRDALSSPHLYKLMDGLRSETKTNIMCRMAGLVPQKVSTKQNEWSHINLSQSHNLSLLKCVCV